MRVFIRTLQLAATLALLGIGSCSLHSGLKPRGFSSGEESLAVGFGIAALAGALLLIRKWFWENTDAKAGPSPLQQLTYDRHRKQEGTFALSEPKMLAELPVYLWADLKEPFKTWHARDTLVPPEMLSLFQVVSHAYLFFLWQILVSREFGEQVAARVRIEQLNRIDRLGNSMGQNFFSIVDEIQKVMIHSIENPMPVPGQPNMQVPHLYGVALYILATWQDSPYYVEPAYRGTNSLDMHGHDFMLAECLAHCADEGGRYFSNLLISVAIDARNLSAWAQQRN
jgi:hypothetical protein